MNHLEQAVQENHRLVDAYNATHEYNPMAGNDREWTPDNYETQFELASVKIAWLSSELIAAKERIEELETLLKTQARP